MWEEFPEAVGTVFELRLREALETQQVVEFEDYYVPLERWYSIRAFPSDNGLTIYYMDTTESQRDIHELAERARQQSALAALSQRCVTAAGASLEEVLDDVARTVADVLGAVLVEIVGQPLEYAASPVVARAASGPPDGRAAADELQEGGSAEPPVRVPVPGGGTAATELLIQMGSGRTLGAEARDFLAAVVALIASCGRQIERTLEASHQALHDPLTGLPNRRLLLSHLDEVLARSRDGAVRPAVLEVSVERMWLITGSYGHRAADELLVALGERVRRLTEPHVMLSRLSDDLFVLVVDEPVGELEPIRIAQRLHTAMREAIRIASGEHFLVLNIGIAHAGAQTHAEALLRDADAALQRADGSRRTVVFDERVRSEITHHAALDRRRRRRRGSTTTNCLTSRRRRRWGPRR